MNLISTIHCYRSLRWLSAALIVVFGFCFSITATFAQTLLKGDYMEDYSDWRGASITGINASFTGGISTAGDNPASTAFYASVDSAYIVKGSGTGSSSVEADTFLYPNLLGLLPANQYQIRFKLASFGLATSTNLTAGLDVSDFVQMDYSTDNGTTWFKDVKVNGYSNAMWGFSGNNGTMVNVTKNATLSTTTPVAYQSTSANPVARVAVNLPAGTTQLRLRFCFQLNANGESLLLDDVEVWDMGVPLPVELISFTCSEKSGNRLVEWVVASQCNNDRFVLSSSVDGIHYEEQVNIPGAGTCNETRAYRYTDSRRCNGVIYYQLRQVDFDGNSEEFGPIASYCVRRRTDDADYFNLLGQQQRQSDHPAAVFQFDK